MKSWKDKLKDEFDALTPDLREDVRNAPIITDQEDAHVNVRGGVIAKRRIGMGIVSLILIAAIIAVAIYCIFGNVFTPKAGDLLFTVEINPAVAFVTDKKGVVKKVSAVNSDADIVLSDESTVNKMIGKDLSEAIVAYTDSSARLGYLDISKKGDAVRISGLDKKTEKIEEGAATALREYFCEKGIFAVVVSETVSVKEFGKRVGIDDVKSVSELTGKMESLSSFCFERVGNTVEEISKAYEEYVIGDKLFFMIKDKMLLSIDSVKKNAAMVVDMSMIEMEIIFHEDNPLRMPIIGIVGGDYWEVNEKFSDSDYTAEFAALMKRMGGLLDSYENEFGKRIENNLELKVLADAYTSLSFTIDNIEDIMENITSENFISTADKFMEILDNIGVDVSSLKSLLDIPNTIEEYYTKSKIMLSETFISRVERYRKIYDDVREQISAGDYESYVKDIESKYGSLGNYWDEIK